VWEEATATGADYLRGRSSTRAVGFTGIRAHATNKGWNKGPHTHKE